jgi:hypothetical protein
MIRHQATRRLPLAFAAMLLAGACAAGATPSQAPTPTAAPAAAATPAPTPAPIAYGPATVVKGTESCDFETKGTVTPVGETSEYRGAVLTCTDTSNDSRVSGPVTYTWAYDGWEQGATVQWGTGRLENAGGAWDGTMTGSYSNANGDLLLFWFEGSGGYEGLSYAMWAVLPPAAVAWTYPVRGIIFPGSPPAPKPASAVSAAPGAMPTPTAAPAASSTPVPIAYGPATVVSGTEACDVKEGSSMTDPDGTVRDRGSVLTCTDTLNDPRVSGTAVLTWNYDLWGSGMQIAHVQWGTGRIENAGGAWDGTYTGSFSTASGDILLFWYEGTGGYDGLAYGMWAVIPIVEGGSFTYPVRGIVFPGSPPAP